MAGKPGVIDIGPEITLLEPSYRDGWCDGFLAGIKQVRDIAERNGDKDFAVLCSALMVLCKDGPDNMKPLDNVAWAFKSPTTKESNNDR